MKITDLDFKLNEHAEEFEMMAFVHTQTTTIGVFYGQQAYSEEGSPYCIHIKPVGGKNDVRPYQSAEQLKEIIKYL